MMREYGKMAPQFWMGTTGKALRGHMEAQIVAAYLISSPHANMLGLFYQPLPYIAHETGLTIEGASKGLQRCIEAGFCDYDEPSEMVWVFTMAGYQIGEDLKETDKRCKGVQSEYDRLPENPFLEPFFERYGEVFHMACKRDSARVIEAPSKDLRSQEQEQEQEKEQETTPLTPQGGTGDAATLLPMDPAPKAKRQRKGKYQSEDIAPENAEYLQKVYERIPAEHPVTGEPVHKGPYATAARAFQAIIDAGEASARELMAVGTLYYRAESLGQEWADWANRVWDTRPTAMMHVATLYGPEKRPYRQLLPVARELIAKKEQRLASQNAEIGMAS